MTQAAALPDGWARGALEGCAEAVDEAEFDAQPTALPKEKMDGKAVGLVKATGVGFVYVVYVKGYVVVAAVEDIMKGCC